MLSQRHFDDELAVQLLVELPRPGNFTYSWQSIRLLLITPATCQNNVAVLAKALASGKQVIDAESLGILGVRSISYIAIAVKASTVLIAVKLTQRNVAFPTINEFQKRVRHVRGLIFQTQYTPTQLACQVLPRRQSIIFSSILKMDMEASSSGIAKVTAPGPFLATNPHRPAPPVPMKMKPIRSSSLVVAGGHVSYWRTPTTTPEKINLERLLSSDTSLAMRCPHDVYIRLIFSLTR